MEILKLANKEIKSIGFQDISDCVCRLFISANYSLPTCVCDKVIKAIENERSSLAKSVLGTLQENATVARDGVFPICQDTGMAVLFVTIGRNVYLDCDINDAVNDGVRRAYNDGYLRKSIVFDPLFHRVNTNDNTPALIHIEMSSDEELNGKIKFCAAPKGFGSENMSRIKMFTPSATVEEITDFVVECVKTAGSNPCPPIFVGVGIGGDFEGSAILAKKALLRENENVNEEYRELERDMLSRINSLGIGPQGFGGDTTALAVYIESAPTHIAGLPVAVNINCHVARHKAEIIG